MGGKKEFTSMQIFAVCLYYSQCSITFNFNLNIKTPLNPFSKNKASKITGQHHLQEPH